MSIFDEEMSKNVGEIENNDMKALCGIDVSNDCYEAAAATWKAIKGAMLGKELFEKGKREDANKAYKEVVGSSLTFKGFKKGGWYGVMDHIVLPNSEKGKELGCFGDAFFSCGEPNVDKADPNFPAALKDGIMKLFVLAECIRNLAIKGVLTGKQPTLSINTIGSMKSLGKVNANIYQEYNKFLKSVEEELKKELKRTNTPDKVLVPVTVKSDEEAWNMIAKAMKDTQARKEAAFIWNYMRKGSGGAKTEEEKEFKDSLQKHIRYLIDRARTIPKGQEDFQDADLKDFLKALKKFFGDFEKRKKTLAANKREHDREDKKRKAEKEAENLKNAGTPSAPPPPPPMMRPPISLGGAMKLRKTPGKKN